MTEDLENKLQKLRDRWKNEPEKRSIIQWQAKLIQMAMKARNRVQSETPIEGYMEDMQEVSL